MVENDDVTAENEPTGQPEDQSWLEMEDVRGNVLSAAEIERMAHTDG